MEYKKEELKILIVDDSEIDLVLLELILLQIGFKNIIKAGSGREGLRLAKKHKPDLVISDIMMPGMDGGDLRARLKENLATKNIPVIFVSALVTQKEEKQYERQNTSKNLLIAKPFAREAISETIDVALRRIP